MQALPHHACPLCGAANRCAVAAAGSFSVECWCARSPVSAAALARVPEPLRGTACLCPACAANGSPPRDGDPPGPRDGPDDFRHP